MLFRFFAFALFYASAALAQSDTDRSAQLFLELNALQDVGANCRLTFLARNETGAAIEEAVFETVVFDTTGGVMSLSLFDFQNLPMDRPRVRQFDLPGVACDTLGQALINGASICMVDGAESGVCDQALSLSSRLSVELLG
ncbi:MAG: hypothetical protein R8G34_08865 [Paracoccaceae bacterium]|nr:hypothetical protein [Paracoccaceae bacterium]